MRLTSILTAAALVAIGTSAFAADETKTLTNNVGARILRPITLAKNGSSAQVDGQDLFFGKFVVPTGQTGNATMQIVPTAGGFTATPGVGTTGITYVNNTAFTPTYDLGANSGSTVSVTVALPTAADGLGTGLTISAPSLFISNASNNTPANGATVTMSADTAAIRIGATLTINAATVLPGLYTKTYDLTVAYN